MRMKIIRQIWEAFASSIKGFDSPRQLALGLTFGMMLGLLPKDSLFPYALGLIALLTNANLLTLIVSGFVFSSIGPLADPLTHQIGQWVLTFDPFEPAWIWLCQIPIVPWTRFTNTVVMGSLVLGIVTSVPTYAVSTQFFHKYGNAFFNLVFKNRFANWLIGSSKPEIQEQIS